jgi:hypothetical protein
MEMQMTMLGMKRGWPKFGYRTIDMNTFVEVGYNVQVVARFIRRSWPTLFWFGSETDGLWSTKELRTEPDKLCNHNYLVPTRNECCWLQSILLPAVGAHQIHTHRVRTPCGVAGKKTNKHLICLSIISSCYAELRNLLPLKSESSLRNLFPVLQVHIRTWESGHPERAFYDSIRRCLRWLEAS